MAPKKLSAQKSVEVPPAKKPRTEAVQAPAAPTPAAAPVVASNPRIQQSVKVKIALKNPKFFPEVPQSVLETSANMAYDCLVVEHDARHIMQHKMLEVVDEAVSTSKKSFDDSLKVAVEFVETAEPKKQELIKVEAAMQAALESKQAEVAKAKEDGKEAAEQLKKGEDAAHDAAAAVVTAKQAKDAAEAEESKTKKVLDEFAALDGAASDAVQAAMVTLGPKLKALPRIEGAQVDILSTCLCKPDAERSNLESSAMMLIEGCLSRHMRGHGQAIVQCDGALKEKEAVKAASDEQVEKLKEQVALCGEKLKSEEAALEVGRQKVSDAAADLKEHEKQTALGDSKVEAVKALLAQFGEMEEAYRSLKDPKEPTPPPAEAGAADLTNDSLHLAQELVAAVNGPAAGQ